MIEIIPAIMPADFADLNEKLSLVANVVPLVQIDVMDGRFVQSSSWPYRRSDDNFAKIVAEDEGMPYWEDLDYEIDLMVNKPEDHIDAWIAAGAKRLIVHVESTTILSEIIDRLKGVVEIGLAIGVDTPLLALDPHIASIDFIQHMGIRKIGFQGEPFEESILERIKQLRQAHSELIMSVDGGVNFDTAPLLVEAGVNRLVSGSAIFESENIIEAIEELRHSSE